MKSEREKLLEKQQENCKHEYIWSPGKKDGHTIYKEICVNCGFIKLIKDIYGEVIFQWD